MRRDRDARRGLVRVKDHQGQLAVSAAVFLASFLVFILSLHLYRLLILFPLLLVYLFLFFSKTLNEREVMEEPESLLRNPLIALLTLVLVALFALSIFL